MSFRRAVARRNLAFNSKERSLVAKSAPRDDSEAVPILENNYSKGTAKQYRSLKKNRQKVQRTPQGFPLAVPNVKNKESKGTNEK